MQYAVRYVSRGGNTKRVAEAIAMALGVVEEKADAPVTERVDLLFLGGAVYAGTIDRALRQAIEALDPALVGQVALFSTSAGKKTIAPAVEPMLEQKGIPVNRRAFHCPGKFLCMRRGRPNADDLRTAMRFAREAVDEK